MVVVLVLFLFLGIVGGSVSSILSESHRAGLSRLQSAQAFYNAEAGLQWALYNRIGEIGQISFAGGSISLVEKNMWRYEIEGRVGDAVRRVRGYRTIEYYPGTREWDPKEDFRFFVKNQTGYWIDFDAMMLEWSGPEAYYRKIRITEEEETSLETVWDKGWYGGRFAGSGEKVGLSVNRWVAPGETVEIKIDDCESGRYGGSNVDMRAVPVKVTFYDGSYAYQFTVVGLHEP